MPNLDLSLALDDTSLSAIAAGHDHSLAMDFPLDGMLVSANAADDCRLHLTQTLAPMSLFMTSMPGRVFAFDLNLEEAKPTAQITLGDEPEHPVLPAQLFNLTGPVRESGGAILCFVGPPWKTVEWRMVQGTGTLTPYTTYTDEYGRASCRLDVGYYNRKTTIVVGVAYVP